MRVRNIQSALLVACSLFSAAAFAQTVIASGPEQTDVRQLATFTGVQLDAPSIATFTVSPTSSISITGPANVLPLVTTEIHDKKLIVALKGSVMMLKTLTVAITGPSLQAVDISGAATLKASGLDDSTLALDVSGAGSIVATGHARAVIASISGTGHIDVSDIQAKTLNADVSGTGKLHGYASDVAVVSVSGVGSVQVDGKPATRTVNRSGVGSIQFD